jgi:hypothetical protein
MQCKNLADYQICAGAEKGKDSCKVSPLIAWYRESIIMLSYGCFGSSPTPTRSFHEHVVFMFPSSCVLLVKLSDWRGQGWGVGEEPNHMNARKLAPL